MQLIDVFREAGFAYPVLTASLFMVGSVLFAFGFMVLLGFCWMLITRRVRK